MPAFGASRTPGNLVFGNGMRASLPRYGAEAGSRALIVTDERLEATADFAAIIDGLTSAGVQTGVFSGTVAELPIGCIVDGAERGRAMSADLVIGIGGGSCMDAAKSIALLLTHGGRVSDYYGEFKVPGPVMPVIAIPTTSGTGSEVTPVAVVSDPERAMKVGISSPHLIPRTAICDPELTYSCPPGLTAVSGADALTHAIEAFTAIRREVTGSLVHEHVFVGKNDLSDHYALRAIALLSAGLKRAYDDGSDIEARAHVMLGATMAGLAFGTAGTAAAHAIQYPVGAVTHTPHGAGVAVMLPYVMAFNRAHRLAETAEIAKAMGLDVAGRSDAERADAAIEAVETLFRSLGIPKTLAALGLAETDLTLTAEQALSAQRLVKNNPRPLDDASMALLIRAAFDGDRQRLAANIA